MRLRIIRLASVKLILSLCLLFPLAAAAHLLSITATSPFPATVYANNVVTSTYAITNISNIPLTAINQSQFPKGSGFYTFASTCGLLVPGQSCVITLRLNAPAVAQVVTGKLRVWAKPSADGVQYPIQVKVQGQASNQFAYIANIAPGNGSISSCQVNSDGSFGTCIRNTGFFVPVDIIFNNTRTLAYVINTSNNTLSICKINVNGSLGACTVAADPTFNLRFGGLKFNALNTILYITNYLSNRLSICPVNPDGSLGSCAAATGNGTFNNPTGRVAFSASGNYLYVTNFGNATISICPVNSNGSLGTCTTHALLIGTANPLGLNTDSTDTYLYVANNANGISICPLLAGGASIGTCVLNPSQPSFGFGDGVENFFFSNKQVAYFVNPNSFPGNISICSINADSSIGGCNTTIAPNASGTNILETPQSIWLSP